ncbi:MAG: histidine--tRNA ligase [Campylobacterota bacterium]
MITALRGMKDLQGRDSEVFEHIIKTAGDIAQRYGFAYAETPQLEATELFKRSVGQSSDIVGKEMYEFEDKGGNSVCLRPEGTAGMVRSFVQNKLDRAGGTHRWFYHGTMFRYERPQKGRLRQFHQFGCESFGQASVYEDLNVILMIKDIFEALGIRYKLIINSLGCDACMPAYRQNLVAKLQEMTGLCEDCKRRIDTNPVRVLDCKVPDCQEQYTDLPKMHQNLCGECDEDFATLKSLLREFGIDYTVDANLVRGLDYYTKAAFEFVSDEIGAQSSIAGGGRYDKLVEFLGGKPTPAVGFALGIERIAELVQMPDTERKGWYFGAMDAKAVPLIQKLAYQKRQSQQCSMQYGKKSLKAHLKAADKAGAQYCAVIGEDELAAGEIWVKDLVNKSERRQKQEEL